MAILRPLLLRYSATASSLLRRRSLFIAASSQLVSPQKLQSSPPWKGNPVRRLSSAENFSAEDPKNFEELKACDPDVDEIEGCDFSHWLIVVDFPKDPRPNSEEMVKFYEQTCAKALNLSLEEAKKIIYATSTSNYTGFHVQVTEVESEKFQGQPGVVFVLPDSYADKEKKEYGGDKYINGIIIPRPRATKGRRIWEEPRQDQRRSSLEPQPSDNQGHPVQLDHQNQSNTDPNGQRLSPPFTHEGLSQPTTPLPAPQNQSQSQPPQPQPQQSYYGYSGNYFNHGGGDIRRSLPCYPFQVQHQQQAFGRHWVPHQSDFYNSHQGYYPPPTPPQVILVMLPNGAHGQGFGFGGYYQNQGIPFSPPPPPPYWLGQQSSFYPGPTQVDQRSFVSPDWYYPQQQQQQQQQEAGPRWNGGQGQPYSDHVGPTYYPGQPIQGPIHTNPPSTDNQNNNGPQQQQKQREGPSPPQPANDQQSENEQPEQGPQTDEWKDPNSNSNSSS